MPKVSRFLISSVFGLAAALMLPVFPLRSEVRSFMVGGGGDQISHHWSLHTFLGLLDALQYQSPKTLPLLTSLGLFVALTATLTLAASALLKRIFS